MKKKIIAIFLCFVTLFSTSISVSVADTTTGLIAKFEFDENLTNEVTGSGAKVIAGKAASLGPDAAAAVEGYTFPYVDGVTDKAIQLNKDGDGHGLNLNVAPKNGKTYTISIWAKSLGCNFANPIVWIGRSNQGNGENWHSIWPGLMGDYQHGPCAASNDTSGNRRSAVPNPFEGLGITKNESYEKSNQASTQLFDWTMITMVVENGSVKLYYDGQLVGKTADDQFFPDLYKGGDTTVSTYLGANY